MRRQEIVSRTLLTLTVITFALAAPVLVQEKCQACANEGHVPRGVVTVSGKWGTGDDLHMLWDGPWRFGSWWGEPEEHVPEMHAPPDQPPNLAGVHVPKVPAPPPNLAEEHVPEVYAPQPDPAEEHVAGMHASPPNQAGVHVPKVPAPPPDLAGVPAPPPNLAEVHVSEVYAPPPDLAEVHVAEMHASPPNQAGVHVPGVDMLMDGPWHSGNVLGGAEGHGAVDDALRASPKSEHSLSPPMSPQSIKSEDRYMADSESDSGRLPMVSDEPSVESQPDNLKAADAESIQSKGKAKVSLELEGAGAPAPTRSRL